MSQKDQQTFTALFVPQKRCVTTVVFLESQKRARANGLMRQLLWRSRPLIEPQDVGGDPEQGRSTQ